MRSHTEHAIPFAVEGRTVERCRFADESAELTSDPAPHTHLALAASELIAQLGGDTESVAELRLSRAELAEELGDALALNATPEELIQRSRTGGDAPDALAPLHHLKSRAEAAHAQGLWLQRARFELRGWMSDVKSQRGEL